MKAPVEKEITEGFAQIEFASFLARLSSGPFGKVPEGLAMNLEQAFYAGLASATAMFHGLFLTNDLAAFSARQRELGRRIGIATTRVEPGKGQPNRGGLKK